VHSFDRKYSSVGIPLSAVEEDFTESINVQLTRHISMLRCMCRAFQDKGHEIADIDPLNIEQEKKRRIESYMYDEINNNITKYVPKKTDDSRFDLKYYGFDTENMDKEYMI